MLGNWGLPSQGTKYCSMTTRVPSPPRVALPSEPFTTWESTAVGKGFSELKYFLTTFAPVFKCSRQEPAIFAGNIRQTSALPADTGTFDWVG